MTARTYGFLNLGRDKKPGTTQRIDLAALTKLRDAILDDRPLDEVEAAAFLVEINEGDDNDELADAKAVFKGWRCFGERTHEPIFVTPKLARGAGADVHWVEDTAVEHWSPQRSVLRVNLAGADGGPDEALIVTHPAAGPYTAGTRPERYRADLKRSWHNAMDVYLETKRAAHAEHYQVTTMCDLNRYDLRGLRGEVTVFHERTDYGRAWPRGDSWADFRYLGSLPVGLDSHGIHVMSGEYRKKRRG